MNPKSVTVRRLGIGLAAAAALLTSACAAGQQAQTAAEKPTLDGTNASVGAIDLRGLAIEAPSGTSYQPGSDAAMRVVFVNTGSAADSLTSVSTSSASGWGTAAGSAGSAVSKPVPIPADTAVSFGTPDATGSLLLTKLSSPLYPASPVTITFTFAQAGSTTVVVPVQLSSSPNSSVVPGP